MAMRTLRYRLVLALLWCYSASAHWEVRHLVLGKWTGTASAAAKAEAVSCLAKLPKSVPQIGSYEVGNDIGVTAGNFDFGLVGGFTSVKNFEAYEASAPHQHCLSLLKPILEATAKVEFNASASADLASPLRHVIVGEWNNNATTASQKEAVACLQTLPGSVPEISTYEVGEDIGVTAGNKDFSLVGGFKLVSEFEAYEASAPHQHCLSLLKPILSSKAGLEFNFTAQFVV